MSKQPSSSMDTMDNQLASHDFSDRLCLVSILPSAPPPPSPAECPQESLVATHQLWPALKFTTLNELMSQIRSLSIPTSSRLCSMFLLEWNRLKRALPKNVDRNSYNLAYLLATGNSARGSLVLLDPTNDPADFFLHTTEMEDLEDYGTGPLDFQSRYSAYKPFSLAINRLGDHIEGQDRELCDGPATVTAERVEKAVVMTTSLGVKCYDNMETLPFRPNRVTSYLPATEMVPPFSPVKSHKSAPRAFPPSPAQSEGLSSIGEGPSGSERTDPSEESSIDPTYQVMPSREAWRILREKFSFKFASGKYYCLPGKENQPGKDSAVEGLGYFGCLEQLRKHLCAYGLPECEYLEEDLACGIGRWVRYAHVVGLMDGAFINPMDIGEPIDNSQAWRLLKKLGMCHAGGGYLYPVTTEEGAKKHTKFERQPDFFDHIARFGIPRVADVRQSEALDGNDRMKLDLYIASSDVDTFKRINPSKQVNEITPRRAKRSSTAADSDLAKPPLHRDTHTPIDQKKQTLRKRGFQMEFNKLERKRTFPSQLVTSEKALQMLLDNYNFAVVERDEVDYYCLPNVKLTEGEDSMLDRDYFETVQSMRKNLCAFGLPPPAKGSNMTDAKMEHLDAWVRFANVEVFCDLQPHDFKPKEVANLLKRLGYKFSTNYDKYYLPGTLLHKSIPGKDQFSTITDFVSHIARFGLESTSANTGKTPTADELSVSEEERLMVEVFVASVATFDICKRITCKLPIRKQSRIANQESVVTAKMAQAARTTVHDGKNDNAATKPDADAAADQPPAAVVDEGDQDSLHQSPPKREQTHSITKFFPKAAKKGLDGVVATFSPAHHGDFDSHVSTPSKDQQLRAYKSSPKSINLSPSCLTEGDPEIEACFQVPTASESVSQKMSTHFDHYPLAESPSMPWSDLWAQMRGAGWHYSTGNNLVAFYWIHPSAPKKKADMLLACTDGIHYFSTEEELKRYARMHLGWTGEGADKSSSALDMSMTSRAKKRKQSNADLNPDGASPSSKGSNASSEGRDEQVVPSPKKATRAKKLCASSRCDTNEAVESPRSKNDAKKPSADSVNSHSSDAKEFMAQPDCQPTVRDKLECCQMVCHASFNKHQLAKSSIKSVVSSNEADIKDFMKKSVRSGTIVDGMKVPRPGFMYICGGPGTGKTTAVKSCAEEMKKWAKSDGYNEPFFCFINMAACQASSKIGIMRAMLKEIAAAMKISQESTLNAIEKEFKKKTLVLVLDEIDMLFEQHGGIGQTWFKTLIGWAEDEGLRFSLIGISNCVNDANSTRVRDLGHSPHELVFYPYREEDILAILEQRVGKNVVDYKALQLISKRVSASSGDARKALDITSNAVGKCVDLLNEETLEKVVEFNDECMPLVKLPHMMRAIREGMPMRHADVISGLPQAAKVVLCIAISVSQVWGPTAEVSISQLKTFCLQASHHALMDELGPGHIKNLVDMLVDAGLLFTGTNGPFDAHDVHARLKIGVQLDDVEIALEQSILTVPFYKGLMDYVKRQPHPSSP